MPAPATSAELLELVRKSELVSAQRLDGQLEQLRNGTGMPEQATKLAGLLVRDGLLTHFQAEQLLQGKWRRFSIGKYQVLERLGSGGMGNVYLCEHKLMRRRVAVKVLPTGKAEDPAALDRFYREARAVAALDHPNIVRAYDIDHDAKLHFLVMEHVDGSNLQQLLKHNEGGLHPIRAAHYVRQAALGLQHAHEAAGLVHRDIKPGNILVDRNGIVKVLDMGLARFFHDEDDVITKKYDENVLGTADYLAPEQALDSHGADIRADIYSLGATFYFCLTGRTPFAEGTVAQKLIWHQTRQPKSISSFRNDVPEGILAVVQKMMAKERAQRHQTPLEVAESLSQWTQTPIPPPTDREMPYLSPALQAAGEPRVESGVKTPSLDKPSSGWQVRTSSPTPANEQEKTKPSSDKARSATPPPTERIASSSRDTKEAKPVARTSDAASPLPVTPVPAAPVATASPVAQPVATKAEPSVSESVEVEEAPWSSLTDTDDLTARQITPPSSGRPVARRRPAEAAEPLSAATKRLIVWVACGVVLLGGAGLALWLLLGDSKKEEGAGSPSAPRPKVRTPQTLHVGFDQKYPTVAAALRVAQPGDTIEVHSPIQERIRLTSKDQQERLKHVRLMAVPPRLPWLPPPDDQVTTAREPLLYVAGIEGFEVRGFRFDGRNKVDHVIRLAFLCPGLKLQDLELKGYRRSAVQFINCQGTQKRPVLLNVIDALPRTPKIPALWFEINVGITTVETNDHIHVQGANFPRTSTKNVPPGNPKARGADVKINEPKE